MQLQDEPALPSTTTTRVKKAPVVLDDATKLGILSQYGDGSSDSSDGSDEEGVARARSNPSQRGERRARKDATAASLAGALLWSILNQLIHNNHQKRLSIQTRKTLRRRRGRRDNSSSLSTPRWLRATRPGWLTQIKLHVRTL